MDIINAQSLNQKDDQNLIKERQNQLGYQKILDQIQQQKCTSDLLDILKNIQLQNNVYLQSATKCQQRQKQINEEERNDNAKTLNLNFQLEQNCRELQSKLKEVNELKKKIEDEENQKHDEFIKACKDGLQNAQSQIDNCIKENQEKEIKNLQLFLNSRYREEIKTLIEKYESRGQAILEQVNKLEEHEKLQNQNMLEKYNNVQKNFGEQLLLKGQLENLKKELNDHKFKIVLYDQRQKDFLLSLEQSLEMLQKVEYQLKMSLSKIKYLQINQKKVKKQTEKSENIMLEMITSNNLIKEDIEKQKIIKDQISQKCRELQSQIKK